MKKRILVWALLLTMGISSSFANKAEGVNQRIMNSFRKEFVDAKEVKWETSKEFVKATFSLNSQVLFAYYTENGDLLALTRNILSSQLPISLLAELKKSYADFWITDLFEIVSGTDTAYYTTVENAGSVIVLKSSGTSGWELYKKEKKESI